MFTSKLKQLALSIFAIIILAGCSAGEQEFSRKLTFYNQTSHTVVIRYYQPKNFNNLQDIELEANKQFTISQASKGLVPTRIVEADSVDFIFNDTTSVRFLYSDFCEDDSLEVNPFCVLNWQYSDDKTSSQTSYRVESKLYDLAN